MQLFTTQYTNVSAYISDSSMLTIPCGNSLATLKFYMHDNPYLHGFIVGVTYTVEQTEADHPHVALNNHVSKEVIQYEKHVRKV